MMARFSILLSLVLIMSCIRHPIAPRRMAKALMTEQKMIMTNTKMNEEAYNTVKIKEKILILNLLNQSSSLFFSSESSELMS